MPHGHYIQTLKQLGIDTHKETVIYLCEDCYICRSEGFSAHTRVQVTLGGRTILATLNTIKNGLLAPEEASLSRYAWQLLEAKEGDKIKISHPSPLFSLSYVRSKIYGHPLKVNEINEIIDDIAHGHYSDIHMATFLTACASNDLNVEETAALTRAMVNAGKRLHWPSDIVVDKHCVGGLPGNRTSIVVVPIIAAFGLTIPKTSSRAITSPAGTADTMEVLAPVDLDLKAMRKVVEKENGCITWGGTAHLSPVDEILISVEQAIDLDSKGQLVASVLSKKIAAGATHTVIDIPIGFTAKVRSPVMAEALKYTLEAVGRSVGLHIETLFSDGSQPVGRGIGPALEARDVLAVLQCHKNAPEDLRERSLTLAGKILEFSPQVAQGTGKTLAQSILDSGQAWKKFQAICEAQGGFREPVQSQYKHDVITTRIGRVSEIDNRTLARIAKLAGAPHFKAAGVELDVHIGTMITSKQTLFTIHAQNRSELNYALDFLKATALHNVIKIEE